MRILWLTIDRSVIRTKSLHYYNHMKAVAALKNIEVVTIFKDIGPGGIRVTGKRRALLDGSFKTEDVLSKTLSEDSNFDFIICDGFFAFAYEDWKSVNIPTAIFIVDVHGFLAKEQIRRAKECGISTIFHRFNTAFHKLHPYAKNQFNCIWLPHSINMSKFKQKVNKTIEVLHTGVYREYYYPLRSYAVNTLRNKSYFKSFDRDHQKWPYGEGYINLLKSARIHITDGSIFGVPVCKYVEIPAANTLLMSDWFPDLELMGFEACKNMVPYTKSNLVTTVEGLLLRKDTIRRISNAGYNLIRTRHNSVLRARQFVNYLNQLLGRRPHTGNQCI